MCDPISIASFALSAGSSVMQHQQASGQAKLQNYQYEQNKLNSYAAMQEDYKNNQLRMQQEGIAAGDALFDNHLQTLQGVSTANVAAGESGVSGWSVARLMNNVKAVGSREAVNIMTNRDWNIASIQNQQAGVRDQTIGRINSVARGVKPSALATAFKIGAAGVNSYGSYKANQE